MKNTKKLLAAILAVAMSAALFTGCASAPATDGGNSSKTESTAPEITASTAPESTAPIDGEITSADQLNGLKVGCQAGTTGNTWLLENCDKLPPTEYKTGMEAALDLKNGKIDAIVFDELPAKAIVAKNDDLKILDIKFAKEQYAIAVKKGNTELVATINETIKGMKDSGEYEKLANAFVPADGNIVVPEDIALTGDKKLTMGTNAEFPPFEYIDGEKIVGFDISMCQQVALTYGAKLEVANMAFDSLIAALQAGKIDMIAAGMSVTEERQKNVDFSDTYYESEQVIIVKK